MDIKIIPSKLRGSVSIPASKSIVHRALISAALADGVSVISNVTFSQDIYATIDALKAIGAEIGVSGNTVTGNLGSRYKRCIQRSRTFAGKTDNSVYTRAFRKGNPF